MKVICYATATLKMQQYPMKDENSLPRSKRLAGSSLRATIIMVPMWTELGIVTAIDQNMGRSPGA